MISSSAQISHVIIKTDHRRSISFPYTNVHALEGVLEKLRFHSFKLMRCVAKPDPGREIYSIARRVSLLHDNQGVFWRGASGQYIGG